MILDAMTYSVMSIVAAMSLIVILMARSHQNAQDSSNKE